MCIFNFISFRSIILVNVINRINAIYRILETEGEGVKSLYFPFAMSLCRLSIGSLKINQSYRKYYCRQVAEKYLLADEKVHWERKGGSHFYIYLYFRSVDMIT